MSLFNKKTTNVPNRRAAKHVVNNTNSSNNFKRNRTFTGVSSSQSNSVSIDSDSPRTKVRNLSIHRRRVTLILVAILFTIILIWLLVSNLIATVVVRTSDAKISKPIDQSRYQKIIQEYLDNNPLNRFTFTLDQTSLSLYVSNKLPEVSSVKYQSINDIGKAVFSVTMRKPVAGWIIDGKQYYVDPQGIPFEINYFATSAVQIVDNSGVPLHTSTPAIASRRFLGFVGQVVSLSKSYGYTVVQAALPNNTTRELEIKLLEGGYIVKLSIDRAAGEQVEDMISAVKYFARHGLSPQYIDVRVSGKASYK